VGFSTVTTHVILFIAAISIATGLLFGMKNFSDNAESTFKMKSDEYNNKIKTGIRIEVISHNNWTNTTNIYVKNTGQTKLDPAKFDIYIDGVRIPRNASNRTIEVIPDTDNVNIGILDPKEAVHIQVFGYLNKDITHEVTVTTQYETRDSDFFSP